MRVALFLLTISLEKVFERVVAARCNKSASTIYMAAERGHTKFSDVFDGASKTDFQSSRTR